MGLLVLKSLGIKLTSIIPLDDSKTGRNPFNGNIEKISVRVLEALGVE